LPRKRIDQQGNPGIILPTTLVFGHQPHNNWGMSQIDPNTNDSDLSQSSLRDHFLLAMPGLEGSSFARSLTYVCEHSESGAMGLVLSHRMPLTLGDIFVQLEIDDLGHLGDQPVLSGGPVQVERGFVLHRDASRWQSTLPVSDDVSLTASRDILNALGAGKGPDSFIMALGYAGWEAGQLEQEIADNAWLTMPANPEILFNTPSDQRWSAAARQLGIDLNLISATAGHA